MIQIDYNQVVTKGLGENNNFTVQRYFKKMCEDGTEIVTVELVGRNGLNSQVVFQKYNVFVDENLRPFLQSIIDTYYSTWAEQDQEFALNLEYAKKIARIKASGDLKYVETILSAMESASLVADRSFSYAQDHTDSAVWTGFSEVIGHEEIVYKRPHFPVSYKFKCGEVYLADLNPIMPKELGGKRPVLILKPRKGVALVAPMSTKTYYANINENAVFLKTEKYPQMATEKEEVIVCVNAIKPINTARLIVKICDLDEEDMKRINEAIQKELSLDFAQTEELQEETVQPEVVAASPVQISKGSKTYGKPVNIEEEGFTLSKKQLLEIAQAKVERKGRRYSKFVYENPVCYKKPKSGLRDDPYVTFNEGSVDESANRRFTKITFHRFRVDWKHGDETIIDEATLRHLMVEKLIEKYGEAYKQEYARFWVKAMCDKVARNGYHGESHDKQLNDHLKDIGKYCANPSDLLQKGIDSYLYTNLCDLDDEVS